MKKVMMFLASLGVVVGLNGCGGGGGDSGGYVPPPVDNLTTLFLVDENGASYSGIPYICDSMSVTGYTGLDGAFTFIPKEDCTFDFTGLNGTDPNDPYVDNLVYIVDDLDNGKNGIGYQCEYFGVGTTYYDGIWDGAFDYDADDACVFYL